ncbi:MAG: hypothetical protein AAGF23_19630, partial [Acidobacteriota bacterium]
MRGGRIARSAAGVAGLLALAAACRPGDGPVDGLPTEVEMSPRGHYELAAGFVPPRAVFEEGRAVGVCFRAPTALAPESWRVDFGGERGAAVAPVVDLPQPRGRTVCFEAPESPLGRDGDGGELCPRILAGERTYAAPCLAYAVRPRSAVYREISDLGRSADGRPSAIERAADGGFPLLAGYLRLMEAHRLRQGGGPDDLGAAHRLLRDDPPWLRDPA